MGWFSGIPPITWSNRHCVVFINLNHLFPMGYIYNIIIIVLISNWVIITMAVDYDYIFHRDTLLVSISTMASHCIVLIGLCDDYGLIVFIQ